MNGTGNLKTLTTGDVVDQGYGDVYVDEDTEGSYMEDERDEFYVDAVGCSGDSNYDWDYDEPAEDVVLEVMGEDEDSIEIEVTGTLPAEDERAEPTLIRSRFSVPK